MKKKRFDKLGTWPSVSPDLGRELVMDRNAKIAQGLDPCVPYAMIPKLSEFIKDEIIESFKSKYKKFATVQSQLDCYVTEYFKGDRDKPLSEYTRKDIIKFIEWVAEQRSTVTANRCLALVSAIMNRAIDLEHIEINPCSKVKKFREPEGRTRIFTDSEFEAYCSALMNRIGHPHAKILILLVLLSLRFSEVASMRWENLSLSTASYTIPHPKNGRRRVIALNAPSLELLKQLHEARDPESPWIFPANSKPGHTVSVRSMHRKILEEAGMDKTFRVHDIRRSGASFLLNDFDANPLKLRDLLGHSDLRSTLVYARLSAKSMTETSDLLAQKFNAAVTA